MILQKESSNLQFGCKLLNVMLFGWRFSWRFI